MSSSMKMMMLNVAISMLVPEEIVVGFLGVDVVDVVAVLEGACYIIIERVVEDVELVGVVCAKFWVDGLLRMVLLLDAVVKSFAA
ncbi:MAG: hypothetical protein O7C59_08190 [Rickettsia endosymbiont of Ixodes persulcatus]|nr:hypothetical protein [Rickettsia endosymbiont of Ixodes persulcatus]